MYLLFQSQHLLSEQPAGLLKSLSVNHYASLFHFRKDWHEWHLYVSKEAPQTLLLEFFLQALFEFANALATIDRQQIVQIMAHFGVQDIVRNLRIEHREFGEMLCLELLPISLQVVTNNYPIFHDELFGRSFKLRSSRNRAAWLVEEVKLLRLLDLFCRGSRFAFRSCTKQVKLQGTIVVLGRLALLLLGDGLWARPFIQQLTELEAFEDILQPVRVGLTQCEKVHVEADWNLLIDSGQPLALLDFLDVSLYLFLQRTLQFVRRNQQILDASELLDELLSRLLAHSRAARNIIDSISHQS